MRYLGVNKQGFMIGERNVRTVVCILPGALVEGGSRRSRGCRHVVPHPPAKKGTYL